MSQTILVVDDEPTILSSVQGVLEDEGFSVLTAPDGPRALVLVEESVPDMVLLDIWMPGLDGLSVLERLKEDHPHLPVVMMSGAGTIESAVKATKLGAFDYIEKPLSYEKIVVTCKNALSFGTLTETNLLLRQKAPVRPILIGTSPVMAELKSQIALVAPTEAWVLITGENGTGKEVVAHSVHTASDRAHKPMIEVNCAAIPEELIESELFGHEKGSFTGASERKRGKFDLAHKGTLFLDEIADMSLKTQAKILRILQERKFARVGGERMISVDVRVLAATNRDLEEEIRRGAFREDLYYRLNVVPLEVPPLRERMEDLPLLAGQFLEDFSPRADREPKRLSPQALAAMQAYPWPGNVRELKNMIERLVILTPGPVIEISHLPRQFHQEDSRPGFREGLAQSGLKEAKAAFEKAFIEDRLRRMEGNVSATAESLRIERSHLHKKMKALGVSND